MRETGMRLTNMDGARGRVALRAGCSGIVLFLWLLLSVRRGRVGRHAAGDGQYDELPGLAATLPPLSFFVSRAHARVRPKKSKLVWPTRRTMCLPRIFFRSYPAWRRAPLDERCLLHAQPAGAASQ